MDYPPLMGITVLFGGRIFLKEGEYFNKDSSVATSFFHKRRMYLLLCYQEKLLLFFH